MAKKPKGNLCLGRRKGESILIGDDVLVTILEVANGQVRVGIRAPKDVVILRTELDKSIDERAAG